MDELEKKLAGCTGGNILDIATGRGGFIPYLQELFPQFGNIIGIDISRQNIDNVRRKYDISKNITFAVMDASKLALKTESFDTVVITNSLHHLKYLAKSLKEMKRVLKPGGLFLIFEMRRDEQTEKQLSHVRIHHWWAQIDRLSGHTHRETYTKAEISDISRNLGLSEIDFIEFTDPDPVTSAEVDRIKSTCEDCLEKTRGAANEKSLINRGRKLIKRIDAVGFAWASLLCVVGRK